MTETPFDFVGGVLGLAERVQHTLNEVASGYDLTPQQLGLLRRLDEPISMSAFACGMACDPSNVTGLVDRVEALGLVERVPDPGDRRVRLLRLTAKGKRLRDRMSADLNDRLKAEFNLGAEDLRRLRPLLEPIRSDSCP